MMKKECVYILNNVFTGKYCLLGNIGHEIINFYKSENGKHYIYLNPYGKFTESIDDKCDIIMFLVQHYSKGQYLVLAKVEVAKHEPKEESDTTIKYGGVAIKEIFQNNIENDRISADITFDVLKFYRPKNPIFIESGKNDTLKSINPLRNMHAVRTVSDGDEYTYLENINKNEFWVEQEVATIDPPHEKDTPCFLDLIGKGNYELVFSNLLAYFFNVRQDIFIKFYNEVVLKELSEQTKIKEDARFVIKREIYNIDILLNNNDVVIVIENKVKSLINGEKKCADINEGRESQLSNYYKYITNKEEFKGKQKVFLIFAPDYSPIKRTKNEYKNGDKYVIIPYSKIYYFYKDQEKEFANDNYVGMYYKEFLKGLELHIDAYDRSIEYAVKRAFMNRIFDVRKEKNI